VLKRIASLVLTLWFGAAYASAGTGVVVTEKAGSQSVKLAGADGAISIAVSANDYEVVKIAANLFAEDVNRVTGKKPRIQEKANSRQMFIVGTLGHSELIDKLVSTGKLRNVTGLRGVWEGTLSQVVLNPFPGVRKAFVIAGSDRRGTAYGLMQLSGLIGVSPWYWWADVPIKHRDQLFVTSSAPAVDRPQVKYRGFFINDEDWGMNPWARTTFEPEQGNIGPKTYKKVFELMLRLRLNYLWPAMHAVTAEFGSIPENITLADQYGIVAGASHCEPMLYNNVHWNERRQGPWDYTTNKEAIDSIWEKTVKERSSKEAVWTVGIRGIHDQSMEGSRDIQTRIATMTEVLRDQRAILNQYVTKQWGPVAQVFVPYKEVLRIYDAGLQVPSDVTLLWVDDNFGYIRRLSSLEERKRAGGSGVYWHLSYYGGPHSYTWINTTPPALIWEELHKAWENDARNIWVINVGDIKPMEIGIDYFARLAWNPEKMGPDSQPLFLHKFLSDTFGREQARELQELLTEYYRLGTIHKPELMNRAWALSLSPESADTLHRAYEDLLQRERNVAATIPAAERDAYVETIGFPVRVLGESGLIFMADRKSQLGIDVAANRKKVIALRDDLTKEVENYNTGIAGGKWKNMMPGLVTAKDLTSWSSQVRWPWGEKTQSGKIAAVSGILPEEQYWRNAASADHERKAGDTSWRKVDGLGVSAHAMALLPVNAQRSWEKNLRIAPYLEYDFKAKAGDANAYIDFLPTMRIYPGMKLRVAISVDGNEPALYDIPGASGSEDEYGPVRSAAVQNNYVRLRVPLHQLTQGKHSFRISAVDPGPIVDRVWLP
jgi:hypothetical protein